MNLTTYDLEGVIKEFWGFEATFIVDIELRKSTNKNQFYLNLFAGMYIHFLSCMSTNKNFFKTQKFL